VYKKPIKKPIKKQRKAWKIVKRGYVRLLSCFQDTTLETTWQKSTSRLTLSDEQGDNCYPVGFHSYTMKKEAEAALKIFQGWSRRSLYDRSDWLVVPCLIRDIVATGYDGSAGLETAHLKNYVSKQIKILIPKSARI